ncbi:hypothetical protein V498_10567 [Pseudogymnoascus sp. VKM F-4517 (FW-2822)]|nr:hypothetical protein V498_10567 [Pseudogymnoascus sp. VKM F-4517 (FW-2822)]
MANNEKQNSNYATDEVQTETEEELEEEPQQQEQPVATQSKGQRTMQHERQNRRQKEPLAPHYQEQQMMPMTDQQLTGNMGGTVGAIRQSRIKDRPRQKEAEKSSLKIKIELDLEVEVDLYARVKGDVTVGLLE